MMLSRDYHALILRTKMRAKEGWLKGTTSENMHAYGRIGLITT
jgi:hypothetical protein